MTKQDGTGDGWYGIESKYNAMDSKSKGKERRQWQSASRQVGSQVDPNKRVKITIPT